MSAISKNRELSQFGSFLYIDDTTQNVAITTGTSPSVGIGSTIPKAKLDILGSVNVSGFVTASSGFFGNLTGTATTATYSITAGTAATATTAGTAGTATYAITAGTATTAIYALSAETAGIGSTANLNTTGIITASAFYINGSLLVNPELATWLPGVGSTVYRLPGNVGIGMSTPTEKLVVSGNISAGQFISTVSSGTSPFTVLSNTLVTNLNADFLRGKILGGTNTGDIVSIDGSQTLTNKTLTTPIIGSGGATFNGTSGSTIVRASTAASGTLTFPAETGTLVSTASVGVVTSGMIASSTITNANISNSAAIAVSKLASSSISGVTLGNNLNSLTFGSYLTAASSYNGSSTVSVSVAATTLNTANTVVARDPSGDFTAGTISCSNLSATFTVTAADFNSTSDLDLKTNVNTISNSLDLVNLLRGVSFDWKSNGKKSYGVIAQELEAILPDLVTTQQNKSVNYNGLVGVLIQAVKELSAEVEYLKKKVS